MQNRERLSQPHHFVMCTRQGQLFPFWIATFAIPYLCHQVKATYIRMKQNCETEGAQSSDTCQPQISRAASGPPWTSWSWEPKKINTQPLLHFYRPSSCCVSAMLNKEPLLIQWQSLLNLSSFLPSVFWMGTGYLCFTHPRNQSIAHITKLVHSNTPHRDALQ